MAQQGEFHFPWVRWLTIALLGIVAVLVIVVIFANISQDVDANTTTAPTLLPGGGEQFVWDYENSDYTTDPGNVSLRGDTPLGFPTETWLNDELIARTVNDESFEWDLDASPEVPVPVAEVDETDSCDELTRLLDHWVDEAGEAPNPARGVEAEVFAQYTADKMVGIGCELPGT